MPRIAVVTPSLNQRAFVGETLRSVLDQGYPELEYVVVDGGSTDGSVEVIQEHAGRLAWWVSEPDRGHPNAINKGFAHTNGEIMCWINSSDTYYPWTFVTVAQIFEQLPEVEWIMGIPSEFGLSGGPKKVAPAFSSTSTTSSPAAIGGSSRSRCSGGAACGRGPAADWTRTSRGSPTSISGCAFSV